MKTITVELIESSTSFDELKIPASNLKALRQFYIHNLDVNSYNSWMYHVKDSVLLSGKEKMWSQFINSKFSILCIKYIAFFLVHIFNIKKKLNLT